MEKVKEAKCFVKVGGNTNTDAREHCKKNKKIKEPIE